MSKGNRKQRHVVLQGLPFVLPLYTTSDDTKRSDEDTDQSDSAFYRKNCTSTMKGDLEKSNKTNGSSDSVASTSTGTALAVRRNFEPIIISSDEEDFKPMSRKTKKVEESTSPEEKTLVRLKNHQKNKKTVKVRSKQSQSKSNTRIEKQILDETGIISVSSVKKSQQMESESLVLLANSQPSKHFLEKLPRISIGVHRPTVMLTSRKGKPKPRILERKNKLSSDSDLPQSSQESGEVELSSGCLSSSSKKNMSTDDINSIKIMATPKKITADSIISSSSQLSQAHSEQCSLSPIRIACTPTASPKSPIKKLKYSPKKSTSVNSTPRQNVAKAKSSENDANEEDQWSPLALRLVKKIIQYTCSHNHLKTMLTTQEKHMLNRFCQVPQEEYMLFCIKLFTRVQKWYNVFKLSNTVKLNMSDSVVRDMYNYLSENGFVDTDYSSESCSDLLNHLLQKDVKDICQSFKLKLTSSKKPDMIEKLLKNCNLQSTLTYFKTTEQILKERIKEKMGFCVKLNSALYSLLNKVHLLYSFTTSDFQSTNDLYLFMLRIETMEILMPKFRIDIDFQCFSSIAEFSLFADANECKRAVLEAIEKKEINHLYELCELAHTELKIILESVQEVMPSYLMRFTAGSKYTKALSIGTKNLTRHYPNRVQEWLQFLLNQTQFCQQMRGLWYDNLIMVQYFHLKQYNNAAETLIKALGSGDNLSEVAIYELNYRADAIKRSKAHKITNLQSDRMCFVQPAPLEEFPAIEIDARAIHGNESGRKRHYLEKTESGQNICSVENVALKHYLKNGFTDGMHCEGSLLSTILCLLFWDIIYEIHVPGVFINEIQYLPLDFWDKEFYINRQAAIDRRLEEIRSQWPLDELELFVHNMWDAHAHEKSLTTSSLVTDSNILYQIILCIGRVKLAQILDRIVKNFKTYHSGIPDLFLWNFSERKCKFSEVKGEKDKLSTKQKLWLNFLRSVGADAEVCHVHTIGSKTRATIKTNIKKKVKKEET